jgi:hypothetical protein
MMMMMAPLMWRTTPCRWRPGQRPAAIRLLPCHRACGSVLLLLRCVCVCVCVRQCVCEHAHYRWRHRRRRCHSLPRIPTACRMIFAEVCVCACVSV